jgi:hypothetical protein
VHVSTDCQVRHENAVGEIERSRAVVNRPAVGAATVLPVVTKPASRPVLTESAIRRVEHSTVNKHRAAVSVFARSLTIPGSTDIVSVSEIQVENGETDIASDSEEPYQIVSTDRYGLPGSIEERVGRNANGVRQHNRTVAAKGHGSAARERRFQAGLIAIGHRTASECRVRIRCHTAKPNQQPDDKP